MYLRRLIHAVSTKPLLRACTQSGFIGRLNLRSLAPLDTPICSGGTRGGQYPPPPPPVLNNLWKWNNLVSVRPSYFIFIVTETKLFHFHRIFKNGGGEPRDGKRRSPGRFFYPTLTLLIDYRDHTCFPRMLFEHEADRQSVQHHPRDPASVNAMKQTCVIVILA